jgi:hypothetical protein
MRLFVLCSLIVMAGCAANQGPSPASDAAASPQAAASPPAAAPPQTAATPQAAASPQTAATPQAAASPQTAASTPAAAPSPAAKIGKLPFDLPPGFKPTRISGELFYCRKMVVLGSRFPKQLCLNEDQLREHIARNEAMKRNKDEVSRLCTTKDGCAWE